MLGVTVVMKISIDVIEKFNEFKECAQENEYRQLVYRYMIRWANLMEEEINHGNKIKDIVKNTAIQANTELITSGMFNHAVDGLIKYWKYGEKLKEIHDIDSLNYIGIPVYTYKIYSGVSNLKIQASGN